MFLLWSDAVLLDDSVIYVQGFKFKVAILPNLPISLYSFLSVQVYDLRPFHDIDNKSNIKVN